MNNVELLLCCNIVKLNYAPIPMLSSIDASDLIQSKITVDSTFQINMHGSNCLHSHLFLWRINHIASYILRR